MVPWAHKSQPQTASRSVQSFCAAQPCAKQTDRHTDRATCDIYAMHAMRDGPKKSKNTNSINPLAFDHKSDSIIVTLIRHGKQKA